MFWGFNFQALKKSEVTKDAISLHACLQNQVLAGSILCSLSLKLSVVDVKFASLDDRAHPGHWVT